MTHPSILRLSERRAELSGDVLALMDYVDALERQVANRKATIYHSNKYQEIWCWQGDGEDHLESLTCPVLIEAADLRAIVDGDQRLLTPEMCEQELKLEDSAGFHSERLYRIVGHVAVRFHAVSGGWSKGELHAGMEYLGDGRVCDVVNLRKVLVR